MSLQTGKRTGGVSLEAQEAKIRAMAAVQGAELIDVIVDGGESAKSLNRPGLQRFARTSEQRKSGDGHRREAQPADPQRQGPVWAYGTVREAQGGAEPIGGRRGGWNRSPEFFTRKPLSDNLARREAGCSADFIRLFGVPLAVGGEKAEPLVSGEFT